ncbi:MAG: hypothetical protein ACRDYC_08400 [Acidimicrobiales bacterium]
MADMEAGLEHLSWAGGTLKHVDLLLIVVDINAKVQMTARRLVALARQLGIPSLAMVANRVSSEAQLISIKAFARSLGCEVIGVIPEDENLRASDVEGLCPLDFAPDSPGVLAIRELAAELERRYITDAQLYSNGYEADSSPTASA